MLVTFGMHLGKMKAYSYVLKLVLNYDSGNSMVLSENGQYAISEMFLKLNTLILIRHISKHIDFCNDLW